MRGFEMGEIGEGVDNVSMSFAGLYDLKVDSSWLGIKTKLVNERLF